MAKNLLTLFVSVIIVTLFFTYSCNQPTLPTNNSVANQNAILKKKPDKSNTEINSEEKLLGYKTVEVNGKNVQVPVYKGDANGQIGPDYVDCNTYWENVWEFDHFQSKPNKWLGIWDTKQYVSKQDLLRKWGFTNFFVSSLTERNSAVSAGFNPDSIMCKIKIISSSQYEIPSGNYKAYYLDEPLERYNLSTNQVIAIANDVYNNHNHASLFLSSYSDNSISMSYYLTILNSTYNTRIMCDQYHDGTIFCGNDQRDYWTDFKNTYGGARVSSHWIHLYIDGDENDFNQLFGHANNLNINSLWLFAGNKGDDWCDDGENLTESIFNQYIYDFCNEAFENGWLRKFEHLYRYYWKCPDEYGDPCYCNSHPDAWVLDRIEDLNQEREVFN